jgi:hypothetical protein
VPVVKSGNAHPITRNYSNCELRNLAFNVLDKRKELIAVLEIIYWARSIIIIAFGSTQNADSPA